MRKRTSVYIDAELLEFARNNKLNLSKLLEEAIKNVKNQNKRPIIRDSRFRDPGSNPGRSTCFSKNLKHS